MSWAELFERAEPYDITVTEIRESLAARREDPAE
jgi:hypothetical protein